MRMTLVAAAFILSAGAAAAYPLFLDLPKTATPPDWLTTPSPATVDNFYPELANDLGIGGRAVIDCRIGPDGLVELCRTQSESPPGFDFGAAAIRMSRSFRFRPAMTASGPIPSTVTVPVRFVPPPDDLRRLIPWAFLLALGTTAWARHRQVTGRISQDGAVPEAQTP